MKELFTISILVISVSFALSQTIKVDTAFYPNGQVEKIDSIYNGDTILLQKNFYPDIVIINDKKVYRRNSEWMQVKSQGEWLKIGASSWAQHGKWTYWDKKGMINEEIIYLNDNLGTRFVNQWLSNGTQILKAGNGHYYERYAEYSQDSTVYEVRDSLKNGKFTCWCPKADENFYRCETGQYKDNIQQPTRISYHTNGQVKRIVQYFSDRLEGEYHSFFDNGEYSEYGRYEQGSPVGNWKNWNREGVLMKECNYQDGRLLGQFTEFYPSGHVKETGFYTHVPGIDTVTMFDVVTYEEVRILEKTEHKSVKDGDWYFYNENGSILRIEKYREGELEID